MKGKITLFKVFESSGSLMYSYERESATGKIQKFEGILNYKDLEDDDLTMSIISFVKEKNRKGINILSE